MNCKVNEDGIFVVWANYDGARDSWCQYIELNSKFNYHLNIKYINYKLIYLIMVLIYFEIIFFYF